MGSEMCIRDSFLIVYDACSCLIDVFPQRSYDNDETIDNLREWMDNHNIHPKAICGDDHFRKAKFNEFYTFNNIKPVPLGPWTSWPNRAETAVRLFKSSSNSCFLIATRTRRSDMSQFER